MMETTGKTIRRRIHRIEQTEKLYPAQKKILLMLAEKESVADGSLWLFMDTMVKKQEEMSAENILMNRKHFMH